MPEHPATDDRGEVHRLGETAAVLFIGEEIDRQREPTPGQDCHQTVVAEGTDQAIERHRREVAEHCAPFQTEPPMSGQQGIAGYFGSHLAVPQDEVGEDGEHGSARGALEPPDGDPTETDTHIMRVACQAPTAVTSGLVFELKAKRQHEGQDTFEERLPVAK
jgi:hypothetical protein